MGAGWSTSSSLPKVEVSSWQRMGEERPSCALAVHPDRALQGADYVRFTQGPVQLLDDMAEPAKTEAESEPNYLGRG